MRWMQQVAFRHRMCARNGVHCTGGVIRWRAAGVFGHEGGVTLGRLESSAYNAPWMIFQAQETFHLNIPTKNIMTLR